MASSSNISRPASLPDVRTLSASPRPTLIATLKPFQAQNGTKRDYVPSPSSSRPVGPRVKGRKQGARNQPGPQTLSKEVLPGMFESVSYDKYMTVKSVNGTSVMDLDVFEVHRAIVKACGRKPKVTPQRDGSLLVEVESQEEASRLGALTGVPGAEVSCAPHTTLNQSKGVVFCRDLLRYSEERLLQEFREEGVIAVHRFQKKVDGVLTPTPSLLLTFNSLVLPNTLDTAWYALPVKAYIPNPRRCFHCQNFGHVARSCRRLQNDLPAVCVNCGGTGHSADCPSPAKCYHCGGAHQASSQDCDRYKFEKEVLLIRTQERVSFPEAKKRALTRLVRPSVTYASIASHILSRPTPPALTRPQTPSPPVQPVQTVEPVQTVQPVQTAQLVVPMEASDIKQKRSRSEDSLERGPPAKIQPPELSRELVAADVVAVPAVTTCPQTQVGQRPVPCGDGVAGGGRPAPVHSPSRQRAAVEKRPIGSTVGRTGGSSRAPAPTRGGPTPTVVARQKVPVTCPLATTSAAGAGRTPSRGLQKHPRK